MNLIPVVGMFNQGFGILISRISPVAGIRLFIVLATLGLSQWGLQGLMDSLRLMVPDQTAVNTETVGDILNTLGREQLFGVVFTLKFWLAILLNIALFLWGQGAVYMALYPNPKNLAAGEPRKISAIALGALGLMVPLVLVNIFYGVIVLLGTLLLVIPGVWLAVKYSLAPILLVVEEQSAFSAFSRSSELIKGCWWGVFGRLMLAGLAVLIGSAILNFIPVIGRIVAGVLLAPYLTACQLAVLESLKQIKQQPEPAQTI